MKKAKASLKEKKSKRLEQAHKRSAQTQSKLIDIRIGEMIREARVARKLNQGVVAAVIGVDQSAFSRLENGKQQLTTAQWILLHDTGLLSLDTTKRVIERMSQVESYAPEAVG